jgi:hypothetical protein
VDKSSGRNEFNAGSDSAMHHGSLPIEQFRNAPKIGPATPTTAPSGSTVRDQRPTGTPGSAVK